MFKKLVLLTVMALSVLSLPAQAWRNDEITMLVMPREAIPLQIAQDISRRYPVLIVSYQLSRGGVKLHAWTGDNWVPVSVAEYTNGTFFAVRPIAAVVVEPKKFYAPELLNPTLWCPAFSRITSTDPRTLLHLLGLQFDFPFRHWNQFAKRYGYELEEINPTLHNVHWWHLRGDRFLEKRAKRDFEIDRNQWYALTPMPPEAVEPVIAEPAPVRKPAAAPSGAPDVEISVKAAEPAVKEAPAVRPEPVVAPVPAVEPEKEIAPEPVPGPAPVAEAVSVPILESPAVPTVPEKSMIGDAAVTNPSAAIEVDPFSADEVPAAEIVVPQEPKKSWWKIF
jgi:hypothetical protein